MEFNERELKETYEKYAEYYLNAAKESAQSGYVDNTISFLTKSKGFAAKHSSDLFGRVQKEENEIMNIAYKNGIEFKLNGVEKVIRSAEKHADSQLRRHLVLDAYGWLNDARKYATKIGADIGKRIGGMEEKLNFLGLQGYLFGP